MRSRRSLLALSCSRGPRSAVHATLAALLLAACSSAPAPAPAPTSRAALAAAPAAREDARENAPDGADPARPGPIDEDALAGSSASRDPFQAYPPTPSPPPEDTRPRKAKRYDVEQLKLVALVTGTAVPRAMLVDPRGKGWIVTQGELVGRPEKLRGGAGEMLASWRVDRIREGSVVLVREDPRGATGEMHVLALPQETASEDD